jgi:hypothetical protein
MPASSVGFPHRRSRWAADATTQAQMIGRHEPCTAVTPMASNWFSRRRLAGLEYVPVALEGTEGWIETGDTANRNVDNLRRYHRPSPCAAPALLPSPTGSLDPLPSAARVESTTNSAHPAAACRRANRPAGDDPPSVRHLNGERPHAEPDCEPWRPGRPLHVETKFMMQTSNTNHARRSAKPWFCLLCQSTPCRSGSWMVSSSRSEDPGSVFQKAMREP